MGKCDAEMNWNILTLERMNTLSEMGRQSGEGLEVGEMEPNWRIAGGGEVTGGGRETAAISAKSRSMEISAGIAWSAERTRMETGRQRRAVQHHLS